LACQISTNVPRSGLPSVSNTRPETTIRSPIGSPACWTVRSLSFSLISTGPNRGPVISVMVWGM